MRTRGAVAVGAVVQVGATVAYFSAVPEVTKYVVLLGFVGGFCAAALTDLPDGLWLEGAAAAVAGGCLFLLGFFLWGSYQSAMVGGQLGRHMIGVYISTVITYGIMLLTPFALEGLIAGALVGWGKRRATRPTGGLGPGRDTQE